jgi:hypothetical protein
MHTIKTTLILIVFGLGIAFLPSKGISQEKEIEAGTSQKRYQELETDLNQRLPDLKEQCESILKELSRKKIAPSLESVQNKITDLDSIITRLRKDPNFEAVVESLTQIRSSLSRAADSLERKNLSQAKIALKKSVIYTKVLLESPVLKMTQAEIDMDAASQRIHFGDYTSSGNYLDKAVANIGSMQIEGNPALQNELDRIKSDIVILHQQTILGKAKEEAASRSIWKRMHQAQVESLSHYYDMWSRSYHPWEPD